MMDVQRENLNIEPEDAGAYDPGRLSPTVLLTALFPLAPMVALLLLKVESAPWLTWAKALWVIPSWLVASTILAGAALLPLVVIAACLVKLQSKTIGRGSDETSSTNLFQESFRCASYSAATFWIGSCLGGILFILWKAATHVY